MKENPKHFEDMVRREVQEFSPRPSEGFWMGLLSRMDLDLGPADGGTPAPTDLSNLPGSGLEHWLLQTFNINLITMITVGSLTLTVGVLFFTSASENASINTNNTSPNVASSIEQPLTNTDDLANLDSSRLRDPLPDPIPSQKKNIVIPIITEDTSENLILENERPDLLPNAETNEDLSKTSQAVQDTFQEEAIGRNYYSPCKTRVSLGEKIEPFRSDLLTLLSQDNLLLASTFKVRIQYQRNGLTINNSSIAQNKQQKYIELMQRYEIAPCEDRMVQLTDEYIAIGEVTDEGFRGQLQGSVDLDDLNNANDQPKGKGEANIQGRNKSEKEQILVLKNTDTRPDFDRMLEKLKSYGFKIKSSSFNQNNGLITSIKIHLTHSQGMDWQLKGRKFDTLEFRIKVDNSGKATDLHYQFNEEKLNKIGLTGTGSTSHSY